MREFRQMVPTDHFGWHSAYLPAYRMLFEPLLESDGAVFEAGTDGGGGIMMYCDYFRNNGRKMREFIACDIAPRPDGLNGSPQIIHYQMDAYTQGACDKISEHGPFALCVDDGNHHIAAQRVFCSMYPRLLTENGLCIIEDVQSIDHIAQLATAVPDGFYSFAIDLRHHGRYDNILFVIQRG